MKRALCFVSLCLLCALGFVSYSKLPGDGSSLVRESYECFSGVIRVWVCDGMRADPLGWLNACAAEFEKQNRGIYISAQRVAPAAISGLFESGINPPDMIVWPAGFLSSPDGLWEITGEYPLRDGLDISPYAVPLLTGAKLWLFSTDAYRALPSDMYGVTVACRSRDLTAMTALSTGLRTGESADMPAPGVDLGLGGAAAPTVAPKGRIPCRASSRLITSDNPRELFLSGDADVFVGDLADVARLGDQSGWQAAVTGEYVYADEPALCSIIAHEGSRAAERRGVCEDLLAFLMSDGQRMAAKSGALPAAAGVFAYSGNAVLAPIEAALDGRRCISPPAFGSAETPQEITQFISGQITADQAVAAILARGS